MSSYPSLTAGTVPWLTVEQMVLPPELWARMGLHGAPLCGAGRMREVTG